MHLHPHPIQLETAFLAPSHKTNTVFPDLHLLGFSLCKPAGWRISSEHDNTNPPHTAEKQQHSFSWLEAESTAAIFTTFLTHTRSLLSKSQLLWLVEKLRVRSAVCSLALNWTGKQDLNILLPSGRSAGKWPDVMNRKWSCRVVEFGRAWSRRSSLQTVCSVVLQTVLYENTTHTQTHHKSAWDHSCFCFFLNNLLKMSNSKGYSDKYMTENTTGLCRSLSSLTNSVSISLWYDMISCLISSTC